MDSIPLICLCGQVPTQIIGNDAFQEADIVGMTRSCTKHNYLVRHVDDLSGILHEAFEIATTGRPGPVLIDLPKDVQQAEGLYTRTNGMRKSYKPAFRPDEALIRKAVEMISQAKRPILYCGGGIINSGPAASYALKKLSAQLDMPVTLTLMGLGALPSSDPRFLGMLGMHGTYEANMAMHDCDLLIAIGSRFDDRVTARLDGFSPHSKKIHIDIDKSSINKNVAVDLAIEADAGEAIEALLRHISTPNFTKTKVSYSDWWDQIEKWRSIKSLSYEPSSTVIKPQAAIQALARLTAPHDPLITTEVGQHQMWAAQYFGFEKPNRWMTSGGLGTMGYGLPAAIGAQIAHPDRLVVDVAGDASILMNIQELSTAAQYRLPVKIFILNNHWMGMVRQWQDLLYESRYAESYSSSLPDFIQLAKAFGGTGIRVSDPALLDAAIEEMISTPGFVILDVIIEASEGCFPMIPSGAAHNEMLLNAEEARANEISKAGRSLV